MPWPPALSGGLPLEPGMVMDTLIHLLCLPSEPAHAEHPRAPVWVVGKGGLSVFGGIPLRGAGAIYLRRKAPEQACLYKARLAGFVINLGNGAAVAP